VIFDQETNPEKKQDAIMVRQSREIALQARAIGGRTLSEPTGCLADFFGRK